MIIVQVTDQVDPEMSLPVDRTICRWTVSPIHQWFPARWCLTRWDSPSCWTWPCWARWSWDGQSADRGARKNWNKRQHLLHLLMKLKHNKISFLREKTHLLDQRLLSDILDWENRHRKLGRQTLWRHNIQHNDTWHYNTQYNVFICPTVQKWCLA